VSQGIWEENREKKYRGKKGTGRRKGKA